MASFIKSTFEPVVFGLSARSEVTINIQIIQIDGGILHTAINGVTLALIDAGVPMKDFVVACSGSYADSHALLDLNFVEESGDVPVLTLACMAKSKKILLTSLESRLHLDHFESVMELTAEGCAGIVGVLEKAIKDSGRERINSLLAEKRKLQADLALLNQGGTIISDLEAFRDLSLQIHVDAVPKAEGIDEKKPRESLEFTVSKESVLVNEVVELREQYLKNGGADVQVLNQFQLLEEEARKLDDDPSENVDINNLFTFGGTTMRFESQSYLGFYPRILSQPYSSDIGFSVVWDFVSGLPQTITSSVEIIYGVIDRDEAMFNLSSFEAKGKFRSALLHNIYVLSHASRETNATLKKSVRLVVQIRLLKRLAPIDLSDLRPFGWTFLDLCENDKDLNSGNCPIMDEMRLSQEKDVVDDYLLFTPKDGVSASIGLSSSGDLERVSSTHSLKGQPSTEVLPSETIVEEVPTIDPITSIIESNPAEINTESEEPLELMQIKIERLDHFTSLPKLFIRLRVVDATGRDLQPMWLSRSLKAVNGKGSIKWTPAETCFELSRVAISRGIRILADLCQFEDEQNLISETSGIVTTTQGSCEIIITGKTGSLHLKLDKKEEIPQPSIILPKDPQPEPWLESSFKRTKNVKIAKGDTITLYIDGARYLPQNSTVSRAIAKVFSKNVVQSEGCDQIETCPKLDSPLLSPEFKMLSKEIKPLQTDATLTALIKLYTIDKFTSQISLIGVSLLNLFVDTVTGLQPVDKLSSTAVLNEGNFQLPIYKLPPDFDFPGGLHVKCLSKRVPCSTLLVRIYSGKSSEPPPPYPSKLYNSEPSCPTDFEKDLYPHLAALPSETVRQYLLASDESLQTLSNDALTSHIIKRLTRDKTPAKYLEINSFLKFEPALGVSVAVDKAFNLRAKAFSVPVVKIVEIVPARGAVKAKETVIGSSVGQVVDFDSEVRCPEWLDDFQTFPEIPSTSNLYLIVDILCLTYAEREYQIKSQGWTIFPILHNHEYTSFGSFRLPLYEGKLPSELLSFLCQKDFPEAIALALKVKALKQQKKGTSVNLRICDSRLTKGLPRDAVGYVVFFPETRLT
ncbi:hypothetical protein HDU67_010083 [Dinochytrium kinnereticum]|nr:hypothetical protein HDU67_010083 [Dinochytrium kinnereticum]